MATNIGSLAVLITGNASGLSKELKKAETETQGFARRVVGGIGSEIGSTLGSIANVVGGIFEKITGAITSPAALLSGALTGFGLSALVVESVQLASEVEDTQASFRVLLGDAEKAKSLFADIRKLAGETPLTSSGLANLSQSLIGAGIAQDQIIPTLRTLGDLAQGDEERLKGVAMAYVQVRAKGKLAAEELNQFAERQVPLRPALAQTMKVSESELGNLIERGKVGFPELQRAMVAMTSEGGRFFGLMETRSKTFSGLMSSLKDNVQVLGANFGQAIIEEFDLKPAIEQLSKLVGMGDGAVDQLRPFLRDVKRLAIVAGEAMFDFLMNGSIAAAEFINQIRQMTGGMADWINGINKALHYLAGTSRDFRPIKIDAEVGMFAPDKIRDMWLSLKREAQRGIGPLGSSSPTPIGPAQANQWKADQLGYLLGGLVSQVGGSMFGDAIVRQISMGLPEAAKRSGIDIGKQLASGIKDGLKIEAKQLTAEQLKFDSDLRDRMNPSRVFKRRVLGVAEQGDVRPMAAAGFQAIREAWDDLAGGMKAAGQQLAGAMARGSNEAYSIEARARMGGNQDPDVKQIWKNILEQERKQTDWNSKLYDLLSKAGILEVR